MILRGLSTSQRPRETSDGIERPVQYVRAEHWQLRRRQSIRMLNGRN